MKLFSRAVIPALVLLVGTGAPALAQSTAPKFAYVDSREILAKAPGRATAEKTWNDEYEGVRRQVASMSDSLQAMIADYQKNGESMDSTTRAAREKAIMDKREEFSRRTQQFDQQMQARQQELLEPMMSQIKAVLEELRKEGGYTFIFDVGADGGGIVAADRNLDITAQVVSRLKPVSAARPDSSAAAGPRSAPAGISRPPRSPR